MLGLYNDEDVCREHLSFGFVLWIEYYYLPDVRFAASAAIAIQPFF